MSKCLSPRDTLEESADNCRKNGCWRVNGDYQPVNGVNDGILLAFDAVGNGNVVYQQLFNNVGPALYVRRYWFNSWSDWVDIALKSDLTDIIMVKSFQGTSITIAENASEKVSIPISTPTGYKVVGKISERWNGGPEMYLSQIDLTPTTFTGYAANLRNSEATSIPTISVLFVKS